MRSNSSRVQRLNSGGKVRSWLPASMSFCRCVQAPIAAGSDVSALSVRMSQRNSGGNALGDTCAMRLALKPTMLSCVHWPNTSGSSVNGLSEQKITRSLCKRGKSSGRVASWLPDRSKISSESARSKISRGNAVNPQRNCKRWMPASSPLRSCSRVCMVQRHDQRGMSLTAKPTNAHSAMTCITLRLYLKSATAAPKAMRAERTSNAPAKPSGHSRW